MWSSGQSSWRVFRFKVTVNRPVAGWDGVAETKPEIEESEAAGESGVPFVLTLWSIFAGPNEYEDQGNTVAFV